MGESWLAEPGWTPWVIGVGLCLFGMAVGWLIWGASVPEEHTNDPGGADETAAASRPDAAALDALETEIRQARDLLAESEEEAEAFSEEVAALDQTVKRANGRLKLILRTVQRAAAGQSGD